MAAMIFAHVVRACQTPPEQTALLVLVTVLAFLPLCQCSVLCNEFETCIPPSSQTHLAEAIRHGNRSRVCFVATSAVACLQEAREDCEGYTSLPGFLLPELDGKKDNLTRYSAAYCGTSGSRGARTISITAVLLLAAWALWLSCCGSA